MGSLRRWRDLCASDPKLDCSPILIVFVVFIFTSILCQELHSLFSFSCTSSYFDFSLKSEEMCDFFDKRGHPASVVQARVIVAPNKLIDSQHYKRHRREIMIEFYSPSQLAIKSTILKKTFKLLQNIPILPRNFSLISFKRYKNKGNFSVRSAFQTIDQPGTFKYARARCTTCSLILQR